MPVRPLGAPPDLKAASRCYRRDLWALMFPEPLVLVPREGTSSSGGDGLVWVLGEPAEPRDGGHSPAIIPSPRQRD